MSIYNEIQWPPHVKDLVQGVLDAIPSDWRVCKEDLECYPAGSDIRPLAGKCGILTARELEITDTSKDATDLLQELASASITAEEAVTAFSKRAAVAHQAVACLAGFYYKDARKRAVELDDILKKTGEPVGPLHGLPISVKSNNRVKGQISSAGFSTTEVSASTSHFIQILMDAGAIVYCRTNLPQAIMALECLSFWGETLNPLNTNLSPGGSSGGCSALMAFGGSPLSCGSDIGGSVRGPAACVGLWSLKCTVGRFPKNNSYRFNAGCEGVTPVVGPQCRSLRDINLIYKTVLDTKPWLREHAVIPIPWQVDIKPVWSGREGRIRVGYMESDGVVRPQPPIVRGIRQLVEALKKNMNFEVVPFVPLDHKRGGELTNALYYPDNARNLRAEAAKAQEPILPLTEWLITRPEVKERTLHEQWDLNFARDLYRLEYLEYWQTLNLDIVIGPVQPQTAAQLGTSKYWGYTSVFNLLEWPAAAFPTGLKVDASLDEKSKDFKAANETEEELYSIYKPEAYTNTPICLQAFSGHYEDEKLLKALEIIEQEVLPLK